MKFIVQDMTCGHCAGRIAKAVKDADSSAEVQIDVRSKSVTVTSSAPAEDIAAAISDAGYTPQLKAA